jgi:hypothetical protein
MTCFNPIFIITGFFDVATVRGVGVACYKSRSGYLYLLLKTGKYGGTRGIEGSVTWIDPGKDCHTVGGQKIYSTLKLSIGLAIADLIVRKHMVSIVISAAKTVENRNIHQPIVVL